MQSLNLNSGRAGVAAGVQIRKRPLIRVRNTGGAGAVAILVGANAPLVSDPAWRSTYAGDTGDFCKPAGKECERVTSCAMHGQRTCVCAFRRLEGVEAYVRWQCRGFVQARRRQKLI